MAVPLLLASLGETIVEKAGVINVGIEGMMLCGAFAGYAVSQLTQNAFIGLAAAVGAGIFLSLVFSLLALYFKANQVVVGTAVNILALGLTGVLFAALAHSTISARPAVYREVSVFTRSDRLHRAVVSPDHSILSR